MSCTYLVVSLQGLESLLSGMTGPEIMFTVDP